MHIVWKVSVLITYIVRRFVLKIAIIHHVNLINVINYTVVEDARKGQLAFVHNTEKFIKDVTLINKCINASCKL